MSHRSILNTVAAVSVCAASAQASAAFVSYVTVVTQVTTGGVLLDQVKVYARFNGPTDTVLNVFNLVYQGGATVPDPYGAFYHKDTASYNSGVLMKEYGTWAPQNTGSATVNRPYDSFLTIGGNPTATNTSGADPSWNAGGSGSHAGDSRGWWRPDLQNNGTMGWFNTSPPNLQGRVGVAPNTATDVLLGQFLIDRNASAGTWSLTIGWNVGVAGSAVQFNTGTFAISASGGCPLLYRDLDNDGFGSSLSGAIYSCTPVSGYVSNNNDCNDSNAAINPNTVWYRDADGDTFGASTNGTITQCTQPAGYILNNTDCNDNNAQINPNTTWYRDTDGDGIGAAVNGTLVQCPQPAGYVLTNGDNCPNIANANQADTNSNGLGDVCEFAYGDLNLDGIVNASDVPLFFNAWGTAGPFGDLNFDGVVNSADFTILLNHWGTAP